MGGLGQTCFRFFWNLHYVSDSLGHARHNLRDWCAVLSEQKAIEVLGDGNAFRKQSQGSETRVPFEFAHAVPQKKYDDAVVHPFRIDQLDSTVCTTASLVYLLFHVADKQPSKSMCFGLIRHVLYLGRI